MVDSLGPEAININCRKATHMGMVERGFTAIQYI